MVAGCFDDDWCEAMERPSTYIALLEDLLPLFALAFSIFFMKGVAALRDGIMGKSLLHRFFGVMISSALGSSFAVGCALMLPLFDKPADSATMLGVVVFVSIAGVKIVDGVLYKKLGVHFLDASNENSVDAAWVNMSQEERQECIDTWRRRGRKENGYE